MNALASIHVAKKQLRLDDDTYFGRDNSAYIVAWQQQQALAYRQICRHRGF